MKKFDIWLVSVFLVYTGVLVGSVAALIVSDVDLSGLFWAIGFIGGIAFSGLVFTWIDDYL